MIFVVMLFLELYVYSTFSKKRNMSFNFFCHVDTISWHLLENTGALHLKVMIAKHFQIKINNLRCTHIFLLSLYCYNWCMSQFSLPLLWLQFYHIFHLCLLHQRSDWSLLILGNIFSSLTFLIYLFRYLSLLHDQCTFQ